MEFPFKESETLTDYSFIFLFSSICFIFGLIWKKYKPAFQVLGAFSFLGYTIGMNIGLSLSPVVSAIIPAVLTFIGGISVYLFFNEKYSSEINRVTAICIIISLSFFIQLGDEVGAKKRMPIEEELNKKELERQMQFEKFKHDLKEI